MERRLAAILATDVVGYSRLMEKDEAGTLASLKARRKDVLEPLVARHKGRVFKVTGDGALIEFASAVNALQCALDMQSGMAAANDGVVEDKQIVVRIGVHLGDVMVEGSDLYGDGVNIAARLEGIAEPGGICISEDAYRQVHNKLECSFDDLGPQGLKNIAKPMQAYRVAVSKPVARFALALPDKPSIAVLPFANMSGDPEQEYFSDGITEDIITELSRFRSLFVIARNSSFSYKGRSVKVQEIGRDLGVAYIVEGSVRKAGNRVRVTAQLIEAATGNHVWAEKYDREIDDIFAVQDDLVQAITTLVAGRVDGSVLDRARRKPTDSMTAYDYLLRAEWALDRQYDSADALDLLAKAIEIDPRCARAYCHLAAYHGYSVFALGTDVAEAQGLAERYAFKALEIDPDDAFIQIVVAHTTQMIGKPELARRHVEQAIAINPNDINVVCFAGSIYTYLGDHEEAINWYHKGLRLDPRYLDSKRELFTDLHYMARRYSDALAQFQDWRNPPLHMYCVLAAIHAQLGHMKEAGAALAEFECRRPEGYSIADYCDAHARMCARPEDAAHWLEGYRKAGLLK